MMWKLVELPGEIDKFIILVVNFKTFFSLFDRTSRQKVTIIMLLFSHSVPSNFFATPWAVAHQALLSMEFSRQE